MRSESKRRNLFFTDPYCTKGDRMHAQTFCSGLFIISRSITQIWGRGGEDINAFIPMITKVITCTFNRTEKSGRSGNVRHGSLRRASLERAKTMAEALRAEFVGSWAPSSHEGFTLFLRCCYESNSPIYHPVDTGKWDTSPQRSSSGYRFLFSFLG